ncbi:MAG: hypothetical protein Q8R02_15540 [Hyphomonadaceae bacterium]|nr:hypothetical protein [Hyphomonadaceae bacterium]
MRLVLAALGAFVAVSCSRPPETAVTATGATAPLYNADLDVNELMLHVMEPAAYDFWRGWGIIYTAEGTRDISPRTSQEWLEVENGAATMIAATNVLMLPHFVRKPEDEWYQAAKNLADIAKAGKDAAEAQDKQAMYDLGGKLDEACDACHDKFQPPELRKP